MRKALVVGIDHYKAIDCLSGCVNDAHSVKAMLERNSDGSVNFGVMLCTGTGPNETVTRASLKEAIRKLFVDDSDIALFYFAGHGYIEATGGYLCASDCATGDDGVALSDIMAFAVQSPAKNKIIVLDSCHAGIVASNLISPKVAELVEGMTILTASTAEQYASEENGSGVFTNLFVDALAGAAANLIGEITPGGIYAHIDQSLGPWAQRPVFKTNVKSFVSLRKVDASLPLSDLRKISTLFPTPGFEYRLDPAFEPECGHPDPEKTAIFAVLQRYNRVNLLVPNGAPHMWHAAMQSKTCRLTALGEHYRRLACRDLI